MSVSDTKTLELVVMNGSDWERLKAIVSKYPDALDELRSANLSIVTVEAPTTEDYLNSSGQVVSSVPLTHVKIPLPIPFQPVEPEEIEPEAPTNPMGMG